MACYRNGSCGPYENRSCSECPASKPEYLLGSAIAGGMIVGKNLIVDDRFKRRKGGNEVMRNA